MKKLAKAVTSSSSASSGLTTQRCANGATISTCTASSITATPAAKRQVEASASTRPSSTPRQNGPLADRAKNRLASSTSASLLSVGRQAMARLNAEG